MQYIIFQQVLGGMVLKLGLFLNQLIGMKLGNLLQIMK